MCASRLSLKKKLDSSKVVNFQYQSPLERMSSLKDALARVTRVVRNNQHAVSPRSQPTMSEVRISPTIDTVEQLRHPVSQSKLDKVRPFLKGFQRKRFQKFLEPLDMPQLRIYDEARPRYDVARAEANLISKKSTDHLRIFNNFLDERQFFDKMMELLIHLTPPHLKDADTLNNSSSLASILESEDRQYRSARYDHIPKYNFHEVPPIPKDLTKESFQEYIYRLTHSIYLYRNSSSLTSGIIAEILLHTHYLDNMKYKPYRSVETYNYLIRWFGYDKRQSSFARELLLVMIKDGHTPNINTINQLLKICQIHSKERNLVSTYKLVTKYLKLAKKLGLCMNLSTWNRVYDCVDNIFLKEIFLNKMMVVNLPVSENFCMRILEDFGKTTKCPLELETFVESDLHRIQWRKNPRMAEKVMEHRIRMALNNEGLSETFEVLLPSIEFDTISLKSLVKSIYMNEHLSHKAYLLLVIYCHMARTVEAVHPKVFEYLIKSLCENKSATNWDYISQLVRGIIHHDAVHYLSLPVENEVILRAKRQRHKKSATAKYGEKITNFPYVIPDYPISERYRIMKRLTGEFLNFLECQIIYFNSQKGHKKLKMPWEPLTDKEVLEWEAVKTKLKNQSSFWDETSSKAEEVGFVSEAQSAPPDIIALYCKMNNLKKSFTRDLAFAQKLKEGFDESLQKDLRARRIVE